MVAMRATHTHAHPVVGGLPLVVGVNVIALVNIIVSLIVIGNVDSIRSAWVNGMEIPSSTQVWMATWASLGIIAAIFGGVGAYLDVEENLTGYFAYLAVTILLEVCYFARSVHAVSVCSTVRGRPYRTSKYYDNWPSDGEIALTNGMMCGVTTGFILFWVLLFLAVTCYAAYMVYSAKGYVKNKVEADLLRFTERASLLTAELQQKPEQVIFRRPSFLGSVAGPPPFRGAHAPPTTWAPGPPFLSAPAPPMPAPPIGSWPGVGMPGPRMGGGWRHM